MASIYRATDLSTGRQVAIKLPHPRWSAIRSCSTAFNAKSQSASNWITRVMKVLTDEDRSRIYMVMEW